MSGPGPEGWFIQEVPGPAIDLTTGTVCPPDPAESPEEPPDTRPSSHEGVDGVAIDRAAEFIRRHY